MYEEIYLSFIRCQSFQMYCHRDPLIFTEVKDKEKNPLLLVVEISLQYTYRKKAGPI